jgi:hypothetical protein
MIEGGEQDGQSITHTATLGPSEDPASARLLDPLTLHIWKAGLIKELNQSATRKRLARSLAGVAWIHLVSFLFCQAIYDPGRRVDLRHPLLWIGELVLVLVFLRKSLGPGWMRTSAAINLVAKLWTTFLFLSFSLVTLNVITGFELQWYKPVWATLSSFLFASLAWLFTPWFLVPAVGMWLTGLLMVNLPDWAYLIYGVSWWFALGGVALWISRRSRITGSQELASQAGWAVSASTSDLA